MQATTLSIRQPDDWHLHLRDGAPLKDVVAHTVRTFRRAIVMPNLKPPIRSVAEASAYRERILAALPAGSSFDPLMTLYLTSGTRPSDIRELAASSHVHAVKLYPAGATTHAEAGVSDVAALGEVLSEMERLRVPLLVHAESIDPAVDVFDREAAFLRDTLGPLCRSHPALRVVVEHITTLDAVRFVEDAPGPVAATVTAHHLLHNRNALFEGGLRPHMYCLPVLKHERHRAALVEAATSGNPRFFLGTDSAPHVRPHKESACGCAGIFTAHAALSLYAEVFEAAGALERLEAFASEFGPDFYELPRNEGTVVLVRTPTEIPEVLPMGDGDLVPFRAGKTTAWSVASNGSD